MGCIKKVSESRTIFLSGEIDDQIGVEVCLALLQMDSDAPSERIKLMISSPGGSVLSSWAIIDTIMLIGHVETIAVGYCGSMAPLILMAGEKGFRSALPHSRIMLHQPLAGLGLQQVSDMEIHAREAIRTKHELYEFISKRTGKTIKKIEHDCDRNCWLSAQEALEYGIIDYIEIPETLNQKPAVKKPHQTQKRRKKTNEKDPIVHCKTS